MRSGDTIPQGGNCKKLQYVLPGRANLKPFTFLIRIKQRKILFAGPFQQEILHSFKYIYKILYINSVTNVNLTDQIFELQYMYLVAISYRVRVI